MAKAADRRIKERGSIRAKKSGNEASVRVDELSPAGSKIVLAFDEAIELMRLGGALEKQISVRTYRADFGCREYGPDDVHRVRRLMGMSQVVFAQFLGVDPNTVRSWEQGARSPSPIARRFMGEIEADPEHWRRRVAQSVVENPPSKSTTG
jgi:DNA-binding transcriptional regulator YiaG